MDRVFQKPGIPAVFAFYRKYLSDFPNHRYTAFPWMKSAARRRSNEAGMIDEKVPAPNRSSTRIGGICGGSAHIRPPARGLLPTTRSHATRGCSGAEGGERKKCPGGPRKSLKTLDPDKEIKVNSPLFLGRSWPSLVRFG
jgi:hypothetical protein